MNRSLSAAKSYRARGWAPIPIKSGCKGPTIQNWQNLVLDDAGVARDFACPCNVGVLLGEHSGGLVDVDLDCAEAVEIADAIFPATDAVFGRASRPRSHRLYRISCRARTKSFNDPDRNAAARKTGAGAAGDAGAMIVEVRADGGQTVFPGSLHPSGEDVRWDIEGEPADAEWSDLLDRAEAITRIVTASRRAAQAANGTRNNTLNKESFCAGRALRKPGIDAARIIRFMADAGMRAGLSDEEATATARSGVQSGMKTDGAGPPEIHVPKKRPWEKVGEDQIRDIIAGTALEPIVGAFGVVTVPPLPLSCTLIKALPVVGSALSQRQVADPDEGNLAQFTGRVGKGDQLAKLRIETAGGQVCNFWGLVVAEPSSGKDIGSVDVKLSQQRKWLLASSGSAEGLADQYVRLGNGLLRLGELESFLDPRHWQSKACSFLIDAFNKGWFSTALSERSNSTPRETDFCYPNLIASIQPAIARRRGMGLLDNGFANRFLLGNMPALDWEPNCSPFGRQTEEAGRALDAYAAKSGTVRIPQGYLRDFQRSLLDLNAPFHGYWRRLKNEYGPRLAVVLSVLRDDDSALVELQPDIWPRVETVCWWLYGQAFQLFDTLLVDDKEDRLERLLDRMRACIRQHGPVGRAYISRNAGRGTTAKEREDLLGELMIRGEVREEKGCFLCA
jgi:hypothetical protein